LFECRVSTPQAGAGASVQRHSARHPIVRRLEMRDVNPRVLSAGTISGDKVVNPEGDNLGEIKDFMIDLDSGRIAYAVLQFGGFLGMGDKLFAVPWEALRLSTEEHKFYLDVDKERLKEAPGFDKDNWPSSADRTFLNNVYSYYGYKPYWE
jgi:sporulation protein YlmC with PRC-barrel domain